MVVLSIHNAPGPGGGASLASRAPLPLGRGSAVPDPGGARCRVIPPVPAGGRERGLIPARQADGCPYDETPEQLEELKKSFPKPRDAVSYIMDTFPIVQRKDIQKHGDYRTKLQILEIYDRMAEAMKTGVPYQTLLEPPPGDPKCCHPASAGKIH